MGEVDGRISGDAPVPSSTCRGRPHCKGHARDLGRSEREQDPGHAAWKHPLGVIVQRSRRF